MRVVLVLIKHLLQPALLSLDPLVFLPELIPEGLQGPQVLLVPPACLVIAAVAGRHQQG